MARNWLGPARRRSDPDEMAEMVVWLATASPDYMTAARLNVTSGLDKDWRVPPEHWRRSD